MPERLTYTGQPARLDSVLAPLVKVLAWLLGLTGVAVLAYLQAWWFLPAPLFVAVTGVEWAFGRRSDRPLKLSLTGAGLTVQDPAQGQTTDYPLDQVEAATLWYRARAHGWEVTVAMATAHEVCFAITIHLKEEAFTPRVHDIDVDRWDPHVGGVASLIRGVAPSEVRVRQVFHAPALLDQLRERIPPAQWERGWFRVWRGSQPPLDLMGFHQGRHDDLLILSKGKIRSSTVHGPLMLETGSAYREATLLEASPEGPVARQGEVTLKLLKIHPDLSIAFPCALATIEDQPLPSHTLHTHVTEALVLLEHLNGNQPALLDAAWPEVRGS